MIRRSILLGLLGAVCSKAVLSAAEEGSGAAGAPIGPGGGVLPADAAQKAAAAGEITLIDIRTPQEWAATGSPEGATRLNLQSQEFGDTLLGILNDPTAKPVALICASGNRTGNVMTQLRRMGLDKRVYDVSEGMMGSAAGPGWLKRGLPTER